MHACLCVYMCVPVCLSISFISRVHTNNNYYFCVVLNHISESGGAVLAYFVGLLPIVANEEVHVA